MKTTSLLALTMVMAQPALAVVDYDQNGLSDIFESIYFGGPADPHDDADGDGLDNYAEMVWGTNPTDPNSQANGPSASYSGTSLTLTWPSLPGRTYKLESSPDLATWDTLTAGAPGLFTEPLNIPAATPQRFYRLSVILNTLDSNANGFSDWEDALYQATFNHPLTTAIDTDSDGLSDIAEFQTGRDPKKKDHPAVGLLVFTPLEK